MHCLLFNIECVVRGERGDAWKRFHNNAMSLVLSWKLPSFWSARARHRRKIFVMTFSAKTNSFFSLLNATCLKSIRKRKQKSLSLAFNHHIAMYIVYSRSHTTVARFFFLYFNAFFYERLEDWWNWFSFLPGRHHHCIDRCRWWAHLTNFRTHN